MADYRLIGTNQTPKDLRAKVTGRSLYAEDFRADGMLFAKLLLSPVPRGRVTRLDASRALAMDGVMAVLTVDDLEPAAGGGGADASEYQGIEPVLTNEPIYQGQPIAAVAAVDETLAADAVAAIDIDIEPLPFALDPLDTLRPGGPNPLPVGNAYEGFEIGEIKWMPGEMAAVEGDSFPDIELPGAEGWEVGDWEAALARADLVIEQSIVHQSQTHHPMEPRSAMAYWQNGRCHLHCSTQSTARTHAGHANRIGIPQEDLVLVAEYCGGGFGSKGAGSVTDVIPVYLSRKAARPVMLRVTRDEETYFGRARAGMAGWVKLGLRADGRITAMDLLLIQDSGSYGRRGDFASAASIASLAYQPETMRFRGIPVITNTPPRGAQRAPGGAQAITMIGPVLDRAARELGVDRVDILEINAPADQAFFHPGPTQLTSCYAREAIQMGRELFDWDAKRELSGQRNGSKVTGVGVALSPYAAGSSGYDAMLVIRPDGRLTIHSGVGNLGTHSVFDTSMAAAEVLGVPWEEVEVVWGDSSRGLPWSSMQVGSQTTHAHTRANYAAGLQAKRLLQEIAAMDLGGAPENYDVGGGRVFRMGSPQVGMGFGEAAARAIELGGRYDGHEVAESLNEMTVRAVGDHLAGEGLVAAATDEFSHEGASRSTVVAFAVVEVDTETGDFEIAELLATADCGTVLNPRSLMAQVSGGLLQGISQARFEKWGYDLRWGVNQNKRFHTAKPISIMNSPLDFRFAAVDIPDRENPVGSRGIGEPPVGAGAAVVLNAVYDAIGVYLDRTPLSIDKILNALEGGATGYTTLQTHV